MPKVLLTDVAIRALKAPDQGQIIHFDTNLKGFGIRLSQGGRKTFVLQVGTAKHRTLKTLGTYPDTTLFQARKLAMAVKSAVGTRIEPTITFYEAVQSYLATEGRNMGDRHRAEVSRILHKQFTDLHPKPLSEAKVPYLAAIFDAMSPSAANHAHARVKAFLTWCRRRKLIPANPLEDMKPPYKEKSRDRILTDLELAAIWSVCPQLGTFGLICKLLVCTGQRRGQIAALERDWIHNDCIIFPASIMKTRTEHVLPIGPLARSLLPDREGLLFPSSDGTLYCAWSKPKRQLEKLSSVQSFVIHDFRRYFRSTLSALGCSPDISERIVAHRVGSEVSRIYDRHSYLHEKREAIARYDSHLQKILGLTT